MSNTWVASKSKRFALSNKFKNKRICVKRLSLEMHVVVTLTENVQNYMYAGFISVTFSRGCIRLNQSAFPA